MKKKVSKKPKERTAPPVSFNAIEIARQNEGKENSGGDPRVNQKTKAGISYKDAKRQIETLEEFAKRLK